MKAGFVPTFFGVVALVSMVGTGARMRAEEGSFHDSAGQSERSAARWQGAAAEGSRALERGQIDRAIAFFTAALTMTGDKHAVAALHELRGDAYRKKGDRGLAAAEYDRALTLPVKEPQEHVWRAMIYRKKGSFAAANAELSQATEAAPKKDRILNSVAWLKATVPEKGMRDGRAAVALATRACELTKWKDADLLDTLAAAHAEAGDFEQAQRFQAQAIAGKRFAPKERQEMEKRLELYGARKPYREDPDLPAPE